MNKQKAFLVSVLVGGIVLALPLRGAETNAPSLVCMDPKCDFGRVYADAVVKHQFVLTNKGNRVVNIGRIHAACGCTKTTVTTNAVPPGGTAVLSVELDIKKRRGHQSKAIYCETDDPASRAIRLEFNGVVIVPIEIQPEGIHFGAVGADEKLAREVLLVAAGTNVFHVRSVAVSSTQFSAEVKTKEAGKSYAIKISSDGARSRGSILASIRVQTDHPVMGTIDIPVVAFVAGDIIPTPASLLLIPSPANSPRTYWLSLWSPSGKPFKVTRVECPGASMTNTVRTLMPDRCRIEVKTWGPLTGLDGKSLRVETDMPTLRELLIPLRVLSIPEKQPSPGKP